jgi:hypothetical protein
MFGSELHILREILMHKYGREFSVAVMENRDNCVSDRVCYFSFDGPWFFQQSLGFVSST